LHLAGLKRGSWPREDYQGADSGIPLPKSPFHLQKGYEREGPQWVYKGRTNTLFFDWHVQGQKGFRGTVNFSSSN